MDEAKGFADPRPVNSFLVTKFRVTSSKIELLDILLAKNQTSGGRISRVCCRRRRHVTKKLGVRSKNRIVSCASTILDEILPFKIIQLPRPFAQLT